MKDLFNEHGIINHVFKRAVLSLSALLLLFAIYNTAVWPDSIHNPVNAPYIQEIAFQKDIGFNQVTQKQFRVRYGKTFIIHPNK